MARIKNTDDGYTEHELKERQWNALKLYNVALNYNELKNRVISAYLYEICISQFGYEEGVDLGFEMDLDTDERILKVRVVPTEVVEQANRQSRRHPKN